MQRTVLITGANSGFGYLASLKFAREGWKVYATTRGLDKEGVKEMNKLVKEEKLDIEWLVFDVTDEEAIKREAKKVKYLDVLINNAGYGALGPIESYKTEDFKKQIDVNFFGVVRVTYAFLPKLKKSRDGRIINMASIAGLVVSPAYGVYSSSKFALEAYTEALRYELKGAVKVSLIEPGGFDTHFTDNATGLKLNENDDSWYEKIKKIRANSFINSKSRIIKWIRNPEKVADKLFDIATEDSPRLHNVIGFSSPFTAFLRRVIPAPVWEWGVMFALRRAGRK